MDKLRHPVLDEAALAPAVQAGRLRVFNERAIIGAISASAGIALLAWVLWTASGPLSAIAWASSACMVEATIFFAGLRCRRALAGDGNPEFWKRTHFVLAALAGVAWGSAVWFVWKEGDAQPYLATLTILVGIAGVSMVTMSSYARPRCYFLAVFT